MTYDILASCLTCQKHETKTGIRLMDVTYHIQLGGKDYVR
jgi:hypothetical protein